MLFSKSLYFSVTRIFANQAHFKFYGPYIPGGPFLMTFRLTLILSALAAIAADLPRHFLFASVGTVLPPSAHTDEN